MSSKRQLQKWDSLLGPMVKLVNLLALSVSPIFSVFRGRSMEDPLSARRVVVAKFEGMGSILYAGALARALREVLPELQEVVFFTRAENRNFCERLPGIDSVITLDASTIPRLAFSWLRALWKLRADIYIDLEVYSQFSAFTATASCSWWRVGFFRESANYRTGLFTHSIFFNASRHISENYLQIVAALGAKCPDVELKAPEPTPEDVESARQKLKALPARRWLAVNPHASDLLLERRWPIENFTTIVNELSVRFEDLGFIVTGTKSERAHAADLMSALAPVARMRTLNLAGELSLGGFLALLGIVDIFLTNDTGPLHMAYAIGVPTISLWGPGNPAHYGPLHNEIHRHLYANVFCSPCLYQTFPPPCRGDNICMGKISSKEVAEVAIELLRIPRPASQSYLLSPAHGEAYRDGRALAVASNHQTRTPLT
jgi:ADP-heptose:LPS heptosyltransferase